MCLWGRKVDKQDLRVRSTIEVGVGPWRAEEDWTNGKVLMVCGTAEGPLRIAPGLPQCLLVGSSLPMETFLSSARHCLVWELGGDSLHLCQLLCPFPDSHVFLPLPVWRKPPNHFINISLQQPYIVSPCLLNGVDLKLCSICSKKEVTDLDAPRARAYIRVSATLLA